MSNNDRPRNGEILVPNNQAATRYYEPRPHVPTLGRNSVMTGLMADLRRFAVEREANLLNAATRYYRAQEGLLNAYYDKSMAEARLRGVGQDIAYERELRSLQQQTALAKARRELAQELNYETYVQETGSKGIAIHAAARLAELKGVLEKLNAQPEALAREGKDPQKEMASVIATLEDFKQEQRSAGEDSSETVATIDTLRRLHDKMRR